MSNPILFDQALTNVFVWLRLHPGLLEGKTLIIRDIYGRIRIASSLSTADVKIIKGYVSELNGLLGAYSPGIDALVISKDNLIVPDLIFNSPDAHSTDLEGVLLLDRQITGLDWLRPSFEEPVQPPKRVTFFGLKGGVGRSTAMAVLALELARRGKKILAVDFDLESPGISSLLLRQDEFPRLGVVDWFVEDGVGQGDNLLDRLVAKSSLGNEMEGQIMVVPAYGLDAKSYVEKLSRVYADTKRGANIEPFGDRLHRLLLQLEKSEQPDIVLIDSRAGLHDVAAVAITRLNANVFLFATKSSQTWASYRLLFEYWQKNAKLTHGFRENLKIVDALVPETGREDHYIQILEQSYTLFEETIYEETTTEDLETFNTFNFALNDEDSPHFPLHICWSRAFQEFDPVQRPNILTPIEIESAYGDFIKGAMRWLYPDGEA